MWKTLGALSLAVSVSSVFWIGVGMAQHGEHWRDNMRADLAVVQPVESQEQKSARYYGGELCNAWAAVTRRQPKREFPTEVQWQKANAERYGITDDKNIERTLWDRTRVDYYAKEYAIEIDWAPKWAEAIGQSLYYAEVTGKKPGIILLVKDMDKERRHVYRCQTVAAKYGIKLYVEKL